MGSIDRERGVGAVVGFGVGDVDEGGLREQVVPADGPHSGADVRLARAGGVVAEIVHLVVPQLNDRVRLHPLNPQARRPRPDRLQP